MANTLSSLLVLFKKLLIYQPPSAPPPFILGERGEGDGQGGPSFLARRAGDLGALLRHARRLEKLMADVRASLTANPGPDVVRALLVQAEAIEKRQAELSPLLLAYGGEFKPEEASVGVSLEENLRIVSRLFRLPANASIVVRRFAIPSSPPLAAALVFSREMVDKKEINSSILLPLIGAKDIDAAGDILAVLAARHLPVNAASQARGFRAVVRAVTAGDTALFVDGAAGVLLIETEGYEHRAISRPAIEQTVRGNQSAFTDTLRINVSLIRRILRSPDLVADLVLVGMRSRTDCAIMYLASVADPLLVAEVRRRLTGISVDYLPQGTLEQFISDQGGFILPHTLSTERPDRVTAHLAEGRVAILADGDPFALVVPASFFTLIHSPEDYALRPSSGSFMRFLRLAAVLLAVLLPSVYIGIIYYHPEALPTDLLLAIAGARERIPFPALVEVLLMELSLELVREASSRVPGVLGETIGIVGGIILSQAVVAANLISPVTVVLVAITALASFTIPDYRVGMAVRQLRFLFIVAAAVFGLIGVAGLIFLTLLVACSAKSFGVPFLAPVAPATAGGADTVVRGQVYEQEARPDALNALDSRRQPPVSRRWLYGEPAGREGGTDDEP